MSGSRILQRIKCSWLPQYPSFSKSTDVHFQFFFTLQKRFASHHVIPPKQYIELNTLADAPGAVSQVLEKFKSLPISLDILLSLVFFMTVWLFFFCILAYSCRSRYRFR